MITTVIIKQDVRAAVARSTVRAAIAQGTVHAAIAQGMVRAAIAQGMVRAAMARSTVCAAMARSTVCAAIVQGRGRSTAITRRADTVVQRITQRASIRTAVINPGVTSETKHQFVYVLKKPIVVQLQPLMGENALNSNDPKILIMHSYALVSEYLSRSCRLILTASSHLSSYTFVGLKYASNLTVSGTGWFQVVLKTFKYHHTVHLYTSKFEFDLFIVHSVYMYLHAL